VAEIYRSNGVGFAHTAYIGASVLVSARLDSAVNPTDKMVAWQGNTAIYPGPFNVGFGFPTQPDLAIIELGGNDTADPGVTGNAMGAGPEQYYNGLRRLIDAIRRGNPNASIMFVAISIPGPDSNSCDFTGTSVDNPVNWPLYLRVMDQLAHEYNCAFVNVHAKWGETILSQGYCTALDFHATDAGHADIASVIAQVI
jgi:lysophospholipase L1-like esterase